jgi:hypothetical protein
LKIEISAVNAGQKELKNNASVVKNLIEDETEDSISAVNAGQ